MLARVFVKDYFCLLQIFIIIGDSIAVETCVDSISRQNHVIYVKTVFLTKDHPRWLLTTLQVLI